MKKSIYLVALAAAALLLAGCMKEVEFGGESPFSSEYICFTASSGAITTKSPERHSSGSHYSMVEDDWPLEVATKGNPTTAFSGNAVITGFLFDSWTGDETPWSSMYKKAYSFNGAVLDAVSDPIPWVVAGNNATNLRVYAYAPADFGGTLSAANVAGVPSITYTVPSSVADQKDLIVATGNAVCASKTSVPLAFSHALTAVKFNVDFACTVKSIEVQGVYTHGVYTIGDAWSSVGTEGDFTIDLGSGVECKKGSSVTDGANTLMMIPQTVPAGAQVVMTYDDAGGTGKTLTASIAGSVWTVGKRITYTLSKENPHYIYFDLAAGSITINNDGGVYKYRGYVYTNTASGSPSVKSITGTHAESNEYYVYQSSTISGPGYHKGWTGDVDITGTIPEEGSVMVLPNYSEVRSPDGSKTWSEYITNNKRSQDIIALWGDIPNHPLTTALRTSTNSKITLTAAAAAGTLHVNMTLDNIWSNWWVDTRTDAAFYANGQNSANIGVDLHLKGDNFLHRVLYNVQKPADYFHFTSADGDGSSKGSLTVTPPNPCPYTYEGGSIMSIQTYTNTQYGVAFNGGTIYAASTLWYPSNSYSNPVSNVGGGCNTNIVMEVNGGVLTSVAHCTGAAIGGGGGYTGRGGDGDITITGGKVYAYQYGITVNTSQYEFPVTSTAIGGGSTFCSVANSGNVTIKGNAYVYAESIGGVAIGGGSSGGWRGGNSDIIIEGNPTVIAKSLPGTIVDHWKGTIHNVSAGTAIGGGGGGDENKKKADGTLSPEELASVATGGAAVVTISGGQIYTGSFGGGKNGTNKSGVPYALGTALINISGGEVQGQFIMAAGAATTPTFTMTGGRINNGGLLEVNGYNKVKSNGGAVYIEDGDFTMTGGEIRNASAVNGGVVYMTNGSFSLVGGSILNSTASGSGGAVYIAGTSNPTFEMSGGEISGCNADSDGGAVYLEGGSVTIDNGTIRRNKALGGSGGGICINKGSFTMSDGAINGNYADLNGGGVYISSDDTDVSATVSGGTITENTSEKWGGGLCILPGGISAANVTLGATGRDELSGLLTNPDISGNRSKFAGGGVYTAGSNARITINSGKINNNQVTAYVANENVANEGGMVTLLDGDVTHQVVTFHANGEAVSATAYFGTELEGTGPTTKIQKIVTSTNSKLVAPTVYYCAGFHFNGWNSRPDGLGETYTNGQVMNITENVDLYIQWEID